MTNRVRWCILGIGLMATCGAMCDAIIAEESSETPRWQLTATDAGIEVKVDGELFTEYRTRSGTRPVLWPLVGPTGTPVTRAYPVVDEKDQTNDHRHHRSIWFGHEGLNGVDFWSEPPAGRPLSGRWGEQVHREFVRSESQGEEAILIATNDWRDAEGRKICEDTRTLRFGADRQARWIDFDIALKASEGPVTIADTKEGTFAIRVADQLRVNADPGGRIVNSRGQTDGETWGMPAEWVDYYGRLGEDEVGIAILSHPANQRPTPRWHVRTYGLFAANPFGEKHFPPRDDYAQGAVTIADGETLRLRYRVIIHTGNHQAARIAERFQEFAAN